MSIEQKQILSSIGGWVFKTAIVIIGWFLAQTFTDMKNAVRLIGTDVNEIKIKMVRVEDNIEKNSDDIKELKAKMK